tara:strand:+ start:605 stop:946 length:342 start_codon:yes stop_codon:yes gene_type:complete
MREFIEFKTVGGGAMDVEQAGTYYIPIDNILCVLEDVDGDADKISIWANAVPSGNNLGNLRNYKLQFNVNITDDTIIAFNNALSAVPGGKKIAVQLPAGQEILGYQFQDVGTY